MLNTVLRCCAQRRSYHLGNAKDGDVHFFLKGGCSRVDLVDSCWHPIGADIVSIQHQTQRVVRAMNRQTGSVDVRMVVHVGEQVLSDFQFVFRPFNTLPFHIEEGRRVKVFFVRNLLSELQLLEPPRIMKVPSKEEASTIADPPAVRLQQAAHRARGTGRSGSRSAPAVWVRR